MRISRMLLATAVLSLLAPAAVLSAGNGGRAVRPPVSSFVSPSFGKVLSRQDKQVLYYWNVEKKAGGKVKCVGSCAVAWPPLLVRSAKQVPRRVAGLSGVFGTVRRPNGKLQVTRNRLPLYTYANEQPRQVLCDNVNGWFVVRI